MEPTATAAASTTGPRDPNTSATKRKGKKRGGGTEETRKRQNRKRAATRSIEEEDKSNLYTLLTTTASKIKTFLYQNDINLLPSQTLTLDSLLSHFPLNPHAPPPPSFYHRFLSSSTSDHDLRWRQFFNVSRLSFHHLVALLSPALPSSLPSESALASALYRLSHADSYPSLAAKFGFDSPDSARAAFYDICKAVIVVLGRFMGESRADLERIVMGFGWISLPNCCGALGFERFWVDSDGLKGSGRAVLVQALVDSEGRFLDVSAGWPDTMRPDSILCQTKLYSSVGDLLTGPCCSDGEANVGLVPRYVLGDSCFPILPWLLTPYRSEEVEEDDTRLGLAEREFNAVHNRAMGLVHTTFKRVKSRWQLLSRRWKEESSEFLPFVIVMGCLLHNFLIKCGEPLPVENGVGQCFVDDGVEQEFPEFSGEGDENGKRIRDMLAEHLSRISMRA